MRIVLALAVLTSVVTGCGKEAYDLPYSVVSYNVADTRRAFDAEGVALEPRSQSLPVVTTLGDPNNILEVDVWGPPDAVRKTGFEDLERGPRCTPENRLALRWRGNVRVIVDCDLAAGEEAEWVARATRALDRL